MRFAGTRIEGAFVVSLEPRGDDRGFFARFFCAREFEAYGLDGRVAQINNSASSVAGTLRGLHYQRAPSTESKLVRCVAGSAFDVVVDLRKNSPTFGQWIGELLTPENRLMIYVPHGCAHGFITLSDSTEMIYLASSPYDGPNERVLRWNDPKFNIAWPREPSVLSPKDATAADYDPLHHDPGV